MSRFTVRIRRSLVRRMTRWSLPVEVLIDVRHALEDLLARDPSELLQRTRVPFDGLTFTFPVGDRSNRTYLYVFTFHVKYGSGKPGARTAHAGT